MQNEFDKKEIEIVSIREEVNKEKELKNSGMTSPIEASVVDINPALLAEIEAIKADLADAVIKNNVREIFDYFDIGVFIQRDGTFGISEYRQPYPDITFLDLGIDEEKLIENVTKISGNADFRKSSLTGFDKISYIGGCADFRHSNFKPDMMLPKINGKIIFFENQSLIQGLFIKIVSEIRLLFKK